MSDRGTEIGWTGFGSSTGAEVGANGSVVTGCVIWVWQVTSLSWLKFFFTQFHDHEADGALRTIPSFLKAAPVPG